MGFFGASSAFSFAGQQFTVAFTGEEIYCPLMRGFDGLLF